MGLILEFPVLLARGYLLDTIEVKTPEEEQIKERIQKLLLKGCKYQEDTTCFGAYLYVVGLRDYVLAIDPDYFYKRFRWEKVDCPKLGSLVLFEDLNEQVTHCACYVSNLNHDQIVFSQLGTGGEFRVTPISELKSRFGSKETYHSIRPR